MKKKQVTAPVHVLQFPELNDIGDICTLTTGEQLRVNQSIDYKSATETRISMGKIADFKYAGWQQENKTSIWMRIVDIEDTNKSEWISVNVWEDQNSRGYFKKLTAKPVEDASTEPEDDDDMPF